MIVYLFLVILLVKNFIYCLILKNNKIPKYVFLIFGFLIFIVSIGLGVFTLNFKDKGIIPMILNIDFFLILFSIMIKFLSNVLSYIANGLNNKVVNPFSVFFSFNIKLNYFYIVITIIQGLLILLCFAKQT